MAARRNSQVHRCVDDYETPPTQRSHVAEHAWRTHTRHRGTVQDRGIFGDPRTGVGPRKYRDEASLADLIVELVARQDAEQARPGGDSAGLGEQGVDLVAHAASLVRLAAARLRPVDDARDVLAAGRHAAWTPAMGPVVRSIPRARPDPSELEGGVVEADLAADLVHRRHHRPASRPAASSGSRSHRPRKQRSTSTAWYSMPRPPAGEERLEHVPSREITRNEVGV